MRVAMENEGCFGFRADEVADPKANPPALATEHVSGLGIYDASKSSYWEAFVTVRPNKPAAVMDTSRQAGFSYRKVFEVTSKEERLGDLVLVFLTSSEDLALEAVDGLRKRLAEQGETFVRFKVVHTTYDSADVA